MTKQITLNDYIQSPSSHLNAVQINGLMEIFGKGCREKNKRRLRSLLTYGVHSLEPCGMFGRVIFEGDSVEYCAGQDYTSEIATVRTLIIKG